MLYIATGKEVHASPLSSSTPLLEYPIRTLHHAGDSVLNEIASGEFGKSFR